MNHDYGNTRLEPKKDFVEGVDRGSGSIFPENDVFSMLIGQMKYKRQNIKKIVFQAAATFPLRGRSTTSTELYYIT